MDNSGKKSRFEKMKERMQWAHTVDLEEWKRKVEQLELKLQRQHELNEGQAEKMESNCMEQRARAVSLEKTVEELKDHIESTKADTTKEMECLREKLEGEQSKCFDLERKLISAEMKLMAEENKNAFLNVESESAQLKLKEERNKCDAKETEIRHLHAGFQAKQTVDFLVMEAMEEATKLEHEKQQKHIVLMEEAMDVLQQQLHKEKSMREQMALDVQDLRASFAETLAETARESAKKEEQWWQKTLRHQIRVELVERSLFKIKQEKEKATLALNLAEEKAAAANSHLVDAVKDREQAAQEWLAQLKLQQEQVDELRASNTLLQQWKTDCQLRISSVESECANKMAGLTEEISRLQERHQSTREQVQHSMNNQLILIIYSQSLHVK